jgi:hypothetical protein
MRSRPVSVLAFAAAIALIVGPASAHAQSLKIPDSPSFLVAGMASQQSSAPPPAQSSVGGIGFGVKGGYLYSSFSQAGESLNAKGGWEAGIFLGGGRSGVVGLMAELMYARKSFEEGAISKTTKLDYFEIPLLLRLNIGSSNKNKGVIFYGLAGPVFDFNLKAERDGVDVSDSYEKYDIGVLAGGGLEISRIILEARYNWGLKNLLKNSGALSGDLKNQTFALLGGIRFN